MSLRIEVHNVNRDDVEILEPNYFDLHDGDKDITYLGDWLQNALHFVNDNPEYIMVIEHRKEV